MEPTVINEILEYLDSHPRVPDIRLEAELKALVAAQFTEVDEASIEVTVEHFIAQRFASASHSYFY